DLDAGVLLLEGAGELVPVVLGAVGLAVTVVRGDQLEGDVAVPRSAAAAGECQCHGGGRCCRRQAQVPPLHPLLPPFSCPEIPCLPGSSTPSRGSPWPGVN